MRGFITALGIVLFIALMLLLGLGTSWFGLVTDRPMQKYAEETRHQTFEQSASYEDGMNKSIMSECLSMRSATDPAQQHALAAFILGDAGQYQGHLSPASQACVQEAQGK